MGPTTLLEAGVLTVNCRRLLPESTAKTVPGGKNAEVSAVVLQQSVADLHRAYHHYFRALAEAKAERAKGNPKAKLRVRKPRFKSKRGEQAARFTANSRFRVLPDTRLSLPQDRRAEGPLVASSAR